MAYQKRVVKIQIDLPVEFPEDWDDKLINFYLNESSWCMSNIIELLEQYDKEHGCLCRICKGEVYDLPKDNRASNGK